MHHNVPAELAAYRQAHPLQAFPYMGGSLPYRVHRGGEITLVLLTGGIGKSDLFYHHFNTFAAKGYSVLTFDYSHSFTTNAQLADAISGLLAHLNLTRVYLAGQSYGGFLAQVIAARHPTQIEGLLLSNTGTLTDTLTESGITQLTAMATRSAKLARLLRVVPLALMKPAFRRGIMAHVQSAPNDDRQFMEEICSIMLSMLTNRHERHMCRLMADLLSLYPLPSSSFATYRGRVLLLLSQDDDTFSEEVKSTLINAMPRPVVRRDILGGHLALLLHIGPYVEAIDTFLSHQQDAP